LKLNGVREVLKIYVRAKYHHAECNGSEKKSRMKTIQSVATAPDSKNRSRTDKIIAGFIFKFTYLRKITKVKCEKTLS